MARLPDLKNPAENANKAGPVTVQDWLASLSEEELRIVRDGIDERLGEDILPPTPDEVALAAFQGLLASGKYEVSGYEAAATTAWNVCVPAFMAARQGFPKHMDALYKQEAGFAEP